MQRECLHVEGPKPARSLSSSRRLCRKVGCEEELRQAPFALMGKATPCSAPNFTEGPFREDADCQRTQYPRNSPPSKKKNWYDNCDFVWPTEPLLSLNTLLCPSKPKEAVRYWKLALFFFHHRSFWSKNLKHLPISSGAEWRLQRLESCASHGAGLLLLTGCRCPAPAPLI